MRTVSLSDNIIDKAQTHKLVLSKIKQHEEQRILRLGCEFRERDWKQNKVLTSRIMQRKSTRRNGKQGDTWIYTKKIGQDPAIDTDATSC